MLGWLVMRLSLLGEKIIIIVVKMLLSLFSLSLSVLHLLSLLTQSQFRWHCSIMEPCLVTGLSSEWLCCHVIDASRQVIVM